MSDSTLSHLRCSACAATYSADVLHNLAPCCGRPLLACYDLERAARSLTPAALAARRPGLWRYREVLPVRDDRFIHDLGEGGTPLLDSPRLAARLGCAAVRIKDESRNPTGSFKARGMAVAVARARELGASRLAVPSAGNAAGALSAYAAAAGIGADVFMPDDVPLAFRAECRALGAQVTLVAGLINDCAAQVRAGAAEHGWFDMSTLREPYRVEGKKTMGYELAEQGGWQLPDVIIYPTGGGTGLVGMWQAFAELEALGLIDARRPRMVSVQAAGCAPIVRAFAAGARHADLWRDASTIADGLRVPVAIGDALILAALRDSGGTALAVDDDEMLAATDELSAACGSFAAPEGGACLAALRRLCRSGWVAPHERVVLFNTGSGTKYAHLWR
ncbi:MAG: threonine synthase [Chloroflexi bacterium]|nr:threonine synthase [Chloroflexota bacterium]